MAESSPTQDVDGFLSEQQRKDACELNATFVTDINAKHTGNTEQCYFTSTALLSENKIVIIDWGNKSVKLIDTEDKQIISECTTETAPWDVTIVDETKVAVTLPDAKTIQFMKSENELRLDEKISFNKRCWNVAYVDDKLLVSFKKPCEVRLVNMAGEVLQIFATSCMGNRLFHVAPLLSVSSFNQAIYASDWKKKRVTMLGMDRYVIVGYQDSDLRCPDHTAVDNDTGMVYLCGTKSNNIHLLTPNCRKVKVLLSESDGIWRPRGICYCKMTRRLYVTMEQNDNIKVFQLS